MLGITLNLGLLGYFKYFAFLIETVNGLASSIWRSRSFSYPWRFHFSHLAITYLVDSYKGEATRSSVLNYALFVTSLSPVDRRANRSLIKR